MSLAGTMLGFYPVRVLPSKTAIAPVNPTFLPRVSDPLFFETVAYFCTKSFSSIKSIISFSITGLFFIFWFRLKMNVRCVQELYTVQILTRRYFYLNNLSFVGT